MKPLVLWRAIFAALAFALGLWLLLALPPVGVGTDLGDAPKLKDLVAVYLRVGGGVCLGVLVLLFAVAPWWANRRVTPGRSGGNPKSPTPAWFWPIVFVAMAATSLFSFPRLNHSLWDDEEYNVRYSIAGKYQIRKGEEPIKFHPAQWRDTLFEYREPNNHVLHSILARACLDTWRAVTKPSGLPFVEWPLRIPGFVAGILSIAALAWFLKVWGMPGAGVLAAVLMALHPWHVRYTAECRGYGVALLLLPLLLGLWRLVLTDGRWRWWAALGGVQFAVLYTYPGTAFLLAVLNLFALPSMILSKTLAGPFVAQSGRWFCTNALSALPALFLMMPLVPQMRAYLEYESSRNMVIGAEWIWNTLAHFVAGVGWSKHSAPGSEYPEVLYQLGGQAWIYPLLLAFTAVLLVAGCLRFVRIGIPGWMIVAATLLPPLATVGFARARGHLIYESYVIYALPGAIALVSAGAVSLVGLMFHGHRLRWAGVCLLAVFALGFAAFTHRTRTWLMQNPLQPIKESVLATRGSLDLAAAAVSPLITVSFSIPPYLYDPHGLRMESTRQLIETIQSAEALGRPLAVNIGMPWAAREFSPAMWEVVNDPQLFSEPEILRGLDPGLDRMVFHYRPGAARDFDFSPWLDRPR